MFHYGIPLINAVIVAVIGFTVFTGVARLFVLALVAIEVVVVPQLLKRAAEPDPSGAEGRPPQ